MKVSLVNPWHKLFFFPHVEQCQIVQDTPSSATTKRARVREEHRMEDGVNLISLKV